MNAVCKTIMLIVFTSLWIGISSCTKVMNNGSGNTTVQAQIQNHAQTGTWRVAKFIDSGNDETIHFANYLFSFQSSGVLNATNGGSSYTGTWSIIDNNSNDDSKDDLDFNINFNLTNDFEDLNDDWDIVSYSSSKIELYDVSGGSGGTDYLTFEKI